MSDPQTNLDIEDVLSSIRRLVSEHPPLDARRTGRPRLILTPDIRVDVCAPASVPEPQPEREAATPPAKDRAEGERVDAAAVAADPARNGAVPEPTLEERIAELEHAIAATAGAWEPDTGDDGFDTVEVDAVAALAAARHGGADAAGEDDIVEHEPAEEAPADRVEARHDETDEPYLLDDDEAILDEEMLRDLVAEFVRQELQGALGERITRNVRKLVRAEIQRALAAREFD